MPPKPSKRLSLFAAWAKQEAESKSRQEKKKPFEQGEIVSLPDSEDVENKLWPVFSPENTHEGPHSPPKLQITYTASDVLLEKGYDAETGDSIIYPSGEVIRPYELSILKTCLSVNTSVSLPGSVCPIQIVVLTFINFKRWFPNGCFVFCSNKSPDNFKDSCIFNGIDEKDITVCSTFNAFKQKKDENIGPFIVCAPQTMQKIVETEDPIVSRIRCVAVCIDPGEQSQKYARFVGPLVGKGHLFRLLITTPSRPNKSHKIAPISTRQKTITSMFITEWEEPSATNGLFRRAVIPTKIEHVNWTNEDLTPETVKLLSLWKEGAEEILNEFSQSIALPSRNIEDLLNIDWSELLPEAEAISPQFGLRCLLCTFLTTAYRHLLLNGPRVFYLYCSDFVNNASHSDDIQMCILGSPALSEAFEKVEADYSYNNETVCNPAPSIKSLESHIKYQRLAEMVRHYMKTMNPIRGVILCESLQISRAVCESLRSYSPDLKVILGVPSTIEIPPDHQTTTRPFSRMTSLFLEQKNTVAVMSFERNEDDVFQALDTAVSNELHFIISMGRKSLCMAEYHKNVYHVFLNDTHEPLREHDNKMLQEASEFSDKEVKNMVTGAVGSVNKYAFKFEQSNLAIDIREKKMRFVKIEKGQLLPPLSEPKRRAKRAHEEDDGEEAPNTVEKRKRGRPRKSTAADTTEHVEAEAEDAIPVKPISTRSEENGGETPTIREKPKRGEPRKSAAATVTIKADAEIATSILTITTMRPPIENSERRSNSNQPDIVTISSSSNTDVGEENTPRKNDVVPVVSSESKEKKKRGRPRKNIVAVEDITNITTSAGSDQIGKNDLSPIEALSETFIICPVVLARIIRKLDEATEKLDRILMMKTSPRLNVLFL